MSKARMHFDATGASPVPRSLCGDFTANSTLSEDHVTCKLCRKRLRLRALCAARDEAPVQPRPTAHEPYGSPVAALGCTQDHPCRACDVCKMEVAAARYEHVSPWQETRPFERRRTRFSSLTHALETYVRIREDGYGGGGGLSFESLAAYGVRVSGGSPLEPKALCAAEDAVVLERALLEAYAEASRDFGLTPAACAGILLARQVGEVEIVTSRWGRQHRRYQPIPASALSERLAVPVSVISAVVRLGRHRVTVDLLERGLVELR